MSRRCAVDPSSHAPRVVAVLGDVHRHTRVMVAQIECAYLGGADVIVQVGDLGWDGRTERTQRFVSAITRALAGVGLSCLFVDGNHDAVDLLESMPRGPNGLGKVTNYLWYVPRGTRWCWGGFTWMGLGGAVSVDRNRRRTSANEAIAIAEVDRAIRGGLVDVLVTHDCPASDEFAIPGLDPARSWPTDAVADSDRHRQVLRSVVDEVRPRHLWHGHHHAFYSAATRLQRTTARPEWDAICHVHGLADSTSHPLNQLAFARVDGTPIPRSVIDDAVADARLHAGDGAGPDEVAAISRPAIGQLVGRLP